MKWWCQAGQVCYCSESKHSSDPGYMYVTMCRVNHLLYQRRSKFFHTPVTIPFSKSTSNGMASTPMQGPVLGMRAVSKMGPDAQQRH